MECLPCAPSAAEVQQAARAAAPPLLPWGATGRQQHLEAGVARGRGELQVAAVALHHDPPADVEAQAGALADRLGGVERLEDVGGDRLGDASATVADLDQHA